MIIRAVCFSENGGKLLLGLRDKLTEYEIRLSAKKEGEIEGISPLAQPLSDWCREGFLREDIILFVGATGIAVRTIAPFLENKLVDSPVLVMDELGQFVIPLCGGHVGGANEIALYIAEKTGALPVITTATDINDAFACDVFAKEHRLSIVNKDGIKRVSAKALEDRQVTLSIKDYPPRDNVDIIVANNSLYSDKAKLMLKPKEYVIGIGCKKGKSRDEIMAAISRGLDELRISMNDIYAISTIDIKEKEEGIVALSRENKIPIISFTAELLKEAPGDFTASEFVASTVGVDNVCERAAIMGAGLKSKLLLRKQACDGVTVAVAKRYLGQEDF